MTERTGARVAVQSLARTTLSARRLTAADSAGARVVADTTGARVASVASVASEVADVADELDEEAAGEAVPPAARASRST